MNWWQKLCEKEGEEKSLIGESVFDGSVINREQREGEER
jgi:hypothetical protein